MFDDNPESEAERMADDEPTDRCHACGELLASDDLGDYCSEDCELAARGGQW